MRLNKLAGVVFVWICLSGGLAAQEITGTISGTVTDKSGGVIPAAGVTVLSLQTGAKRETTTTSAGVFFFNNLPVGTYQLTVEKAGFKKYQVASIPLHVDDKVNLTILLQLGEVSQQVVVSAETTPLQTESAAISNLVGATQMQSLPLNGRDFNQLVDIVPGIAPDNGRVQTGIGLFSDTSISVNGNQSNSNLYLIDGEYDLDSGANGNLLVTPSVDSIEEFKILRNNYSAEFGSATGGVINVVTKSGGQTFHGSAFEFVRNDLFDSTDPFLKASGQKKSKLRLNNFGFTGGGPFWIPGKYNEGRKSDFFFTSFEWRRQIRGSVLTDTVPTLRQRQGILDPNCVVTSPCVPQPADPQESPIANEPNVDPAMIDPNTVAFLNRYPFPNTNISNGFNFITSANEGTFDHQQLVRWDHYFGARTVLMARYVGEVENLTDINNELFGLNDAFPSVNTDWTWSGKNAVLKLTSTLTPRLVNDFQFGYSNNAIRYVTGKSSNSVLASRAGFTFTELFPETSGSFPSLNPVEQFGVVQNTAPFSNRTDNFQYKDDLSYSFGKHDLKAGGFVRFNRKKEPANGAGNFTAGTFTFNTFEDFLLGNVQTYSEEQTQNPVQDRARDYALYVQDTWKVRPRLTLDLGLRYQILAQIFSATDNIANFRPNAFVPVSSTSACAIELQNTGLVDPTVCPPLNGIVTAHTPGVNRSTLNNHRNEFEPRIGIAWQPAGRMVVRSGFGIFHGREAVSQTSALGRQPPFDLIPVLSGVSYSQLAPGQLSPFNLATPQPPLSLAALDQNYFDPESFQYSAGVQIAITTNTTLEADYVGGHQIHLGRNRNINQVPPQFQLQVANGSNSINGCPGNTCVNPDTVRPFLAYSIINMNERAGTSRYNALQLFLNKRVSHGVQFQAAYTLSRNTSDTINMDTEASTLPIQNAFDTRSERGLANQDQTQSLVFNYIWELPFFNHSGGVLRNALGGWQIIGITTFRSGLPATVCLDRDIAGTGDGGGAYECQRPNIIANPNLSGGRRSSAEYFNVNAFVLQPLGTFGNSPRDNIRLPGVNNWDLSVLKNFLIPWFGRHHGWLADESATLQFRAEFFNVWNHVQFNSVNTSFIAPTDANGNPLAGQPAANIGSGFGQVTSARDPREIQFALKLIF